MIINIVGVNLSEKHNYLRVGEIRSLLPPKVKEMALTATLSSTSREHVQRILGMCNPCVLTLSPCKDNIVYCVTRITSLGDAFIPLVEEIQVKRTSTARSVIFCRTMEDCATLYLFFRQKLEQAFTEPVGVPDLSMYRLIDMFHGHNEVSVRENIVKLFTSLSQLRIVICTVSFGMGIDCSGFR